MVEDPKLQSMMRKVQALLDRADHPNTPPAEADTARTMAENIMQKYRIEEEVLRSSQLASDNSIRPVEETVSVCTYNSPYRQTYWSLWYWVAEHCGVRMVSDYKRGYDDETGQDVNYLVANCVGFSSDIRMAQMMYTGVRQHFSGMLEPRVDPTKPMGEVIHLFRQAGVERIRVAQKLGFPRDASGSRKVDNIYNKWCAETGTEPVKLGRGYSAPKTYRSSFADAYLSEVYSRLRHMKATGGVESGALVLAGREAAVDEAFYTKYPYMRPKPAIEGDDYSGCAKCKKAKSGQCRDHSFRAARPKPVSTAGLRAGRAAGQSADLSGGNTTRGTRRLEG